MCLNWVSIRSAGHTKHDLGFTLLRSVKLCNVCEPLCSDGRLVLPIGPKQLIIACATTPCACHAQAQRKGHFAVSPTDARTASWRPSPPAILDRCLEMQSRGVQCYAKSNTGKVSHSACLSRWLLQMLGLHGSILHLQTVQDRPRRLY